MNLIPNGSFKAGLEQWESTPSGVTFIKNETKRFVMLAAEKHSAAICSDPVRLVPGAVYKIDVERAVRGDCEISVIGKETLVHPHPGDELVPTEEMVRIQVTARPGHRVGISRVAIQPIGARAMLVNVHTTAAFRPIGSKFEVEAEVLNSGSEPIRNAVARFISTAHDMLDEHRQEQLLPEIPVASSVPVFWNIAKQRKALAPFEIEVEYEGGALRYFGNTLKHVPSLPETRVHASVASSRRWISVGSRILRITAHETDLDYGPALLTGFDDSELGVIHQFGQLIFADGGAEPLWSRLKSATAAGVRLAGSSAHCEWEIFLSPDHHSKGIQCELKLIPKKRLVAVVEAFSLQTTHKMQSIAGGFKITNAKGEHSLMLSAKAKFPMSLALSTSAGLAVLRSDLQTLMPGSVVRVAASLAPAESSIVKV